MLLNIVFIISFILVFFLFLLLYRRFSRSKYYGHLSYYFIVLIVIFLVITIIIYPGESVDSAYNGLIIWATLVIPALLPFFIGSDILINLGVVKFFGVLLEPIMRPIFNVPGEGSFAFAMSITSGYPVGAKIVSKLRSDKILSQIEAQRLISFCSTSGPLFMIGSVSVGMFKSSKIGILIVAAHYIGAIVVGIIFSFYKRSSDHYNLNKPKENLFKRAFKQLSKSNNPNLSIGVILGNAVKNSFNTILMVGGFIILFAVIIRMLELLGIIDVITSIIFTLLIPLKVSPSIIRPFVSGLFEVTIGAKMVADSIGIDLGTKIAIASFVIGWSGFSIHAQVSSIIGGTDIKPSLYLLAKALHATLSSLIAYMIFPFFSKLFVLSIPVYNTYQEMNFHKRFLYNCQVSIELFIAIIISLLIVSLITAFLLKIQNYFTKGKRMK